MSNINKIITVLVLFVSISSCQDQSKSQEEITQDKIDHIIYADLEESTKSNPAWSLEKSLTGENFYFCNESEATIDFQLEVPEAGRYQVSIMAINQSLQPSTFWIEDYVDNKDNRTYNITGTMVCENSEKKQLITIDGSPLNKGTHKMRLHYNGNNTGISELSFQLMKKHQITKNILSQKTNGSEWKLKWSDEFDGQGLVDSSKWTYDIGNWGWGNNELQYYTEQKTENARQENGNLIIEARKEDQGHPWTSARLTTRGKVSFTYGKIVIRAKVPVKRGNWAAGWTLGDDYVDELSWPYCGEIDILESVGFEIDDDTGKGKAHATIHCGEYYFKLGNQPSSELEVENMNSEFHDYSIEWLPTGIKAFVDDEQYFEYSDKSTNLAWPYDEPQNLILNLAIGGGWGGAKGIDSTMVSQKYIIDYVRVFELN